MNAIPCCDFRAAVRDGSLAARFSAGLLTDGTFEISVCDPCAAVAEVMFNHVNHALGNYIYAPKKANLKKLRHKYGWNRGGKK